MSSYHILDDVPLKERLRELLSIITPIQGVGPRTPNAVTFIDGDKEVLAFFALICSIDDKTQRIFTPGDNTTKGWIGWYNNSSLQSYVCVRTRSIYTRDYLVPILDAYVKDKE